MNKKNMLLLAGLLLAVIAALIILKPNGIASEQGTAASDVLTNEKVTGELLITELMEKNRAVLIDEDKSFPDWIELYNPNAEDISLAGWSLSDGEDKTPWYFPDVTLPSGGYMTVFASGNNRSTGQLHTDFSLSASETVRLRSPSGTLAALASCGGCGADTSMALSADGTWSKCYKPTPGFANTKEGYEAYQSTLMPLGPLAIYEAMPLNIACHKFSGYGYVDWLELKNVSGEAVSLADFWLSDNEDELKKAHLPEKTLAPGECISIICTDEESINDGSVCVDFSLDSDSERLFLSGVYGLSDYMSMRSIPYECSYGRMDGEGGFFYFDSPSPSSNNAKGYRRIADTPIALTKDGVFDGVEEVDVEIAGEGILRYTLDGTMPNEQSTQYTGPVSVSATGIFRAVSFTEGCMPSRPLTLSYIINEGHSLPVVSLAAYDPRAFSIMYDSANKELELPATLSLYRDGDSFSIDCGTTLHGETSLTLLKKNISMRFRGTYGESSLEHDIFGGGLTEFKTLLLRAGQDQEYAKLRNELSLRLCEIADAKMIYQRSDFCVLYINGVYKGMYALMEKCDSHLFAATQNVSNDSVTVEKAPLPADSEMASTAISFAYHNDLSNEENYRRFCEMVDIDSLIDWHIMEGYCANTDVSMGNVRFGRSTENDGKWRFMFYDLDATFGNLGSMYYNLMTEYAYNNVQYAAMVVKLMENEEFKDRFLSRASYLLKEKLTDETLLSEFDAMLEYITPEAERECRRYGNNVEQWRFNTRKMRELLADNWRQHNIDALCVVFDLDAAERAEYFGEIDGK